MVHPLRTRGDIDDIRQAYDRSSSWSGEQDWRCGQRPIQHRQTSTPTTVKQPMAHQRNATSPTIQQLFADCQPQESPKASVESLPSTTSSLQQGHDAEQSIHDAGVIEDPSEFVHSATPSIPATPHDFSALFPSNRTMHISHDDSTLDGNMNLRVDLQVQTSQGKMVTMTLFHLRMHSLKDRAFSLRRYCRDSGREVCRSAWKKASMKPTGHGPGLQRSWSNALHSVRALSTPRRSLDNHMKRQDSGYGSMHSMDESPIERIETSDRARWSRKEIRLEFSNYAQVVVKRRGSASNRRYEFEYWGRKYAWRQELTNGRPAAFSLSSTYQDRPDLAYIKPIKLSWHAEKKEKDAGGWIAPSIMRIEDEMILRSQKDLSDVVVATGLLALVDYAIREEFVPSKVEYIGPNRLISHLLGRRNTSDVTPAHQTISRRASINVH